MTALAHATDEEHWGIAKTLRDAVRPAIRKEDAPASRPVRQPAD